MIYAWKHPRAQVTVALVGKYIQLHDAYISVAEALGIDVPTFKAMERVASAVNRADYYAEGRTLKNLGLDHLKGAAVLEYFQTQR